jgi:hypothetical protein
MTRSLPLLSLALLLGTAAFAKPAIFWASDPVGPDETVVLMGDGFAEGATVEAARQEDGRAKMPPGHVPGRQPSFTKTTPLKPLQASRQCVKAVIPAVWKPGVYGMRIRQGQEISSPRLVNAPEAWWVQGDEGQRATPGGWLRVFGKCLGMAPGAQVVLCSPDGMSSWSVKVTEATCWAVGGAVPADIKPGDYEVSVHNGWGGETAWGSAGTFTVIPPVAWKDKVFIVPSGGDTDKAIHEALGQAQENGGGIVHLTRGTYDVKDVLVIPPGTILRGEGMGLTSLYIKNTETPPEAWISGSDFGVESLTVYCFNYRRVISDTPDSERLRLHHVRIRAVPDASRHTMLKSTKETLAAIHLQGRNFRVTECDVYCRKPGFDEGRVIVTGPWGFAAGKGPYYGVISDCVLRGHMYGCENLKGMIFERNRIEGVCCSSTTYWNNFSQDVYVANNTIQHVYGGDREIMTFDAGGGAYFGKAVADGTKLTLATDPVFKDYAPTPHTDYRGAAVYILDGTGAGQYRFVTANAGRNWEVDRPWIVPPDDTSVLSIVPYRGRNMFVNNTFLDGGAVQMYGSAADVIVAGNKGARIDGFFTWGLNPHGWGWQPAWTCQFLDNELTEGSGYGARIWGAAFFGVATSNSNEQYPGPLARGNVFRRNVLQSDAYLRVEGVTVDTLVEGCTVKHSATGIRVGKTATGTVLRGNVFEDVKEPVTGEGAAGALVVE